MDEQLDYRLARMEALIVALFSKHQDLIEDLDTAFFLTQIFHEHSEVAEDAETEELALDE